MRSRLPLAALSAATVLFAPALSVLPAAAADTTAPDVAPSHYLNLRLYQGEDTSGTPLSKTTLTCHPTGGTHRDAKTACTALDQAKGDISKIAPTKTACTMNYAPVTAKASGRWANHPVHFERTYGNACSAHESTGHLF